MSLKNLLVTFVTGEEASIAQRSVLSLGSILTVVMLVAMVTVAMAPMSMAAGENCCPFGCANNPNCQPPESAELICPPDISCTYFWRWCQEGDYEWQIQCPGYVGCSCP